MLQFITSSFPVWGVLISYLLVYLSQLIIYYDVSAFRIPWKYCFLFGLLYLALAFQPFGWLPSFASFLFFAYFSWASSRCFSELAFFSLYPVVSFDIILKLFSVFILPTFVGPFHIGNYAFYELFAILLATPMNYWYLILVQFDSQTISRLEFKKRYSYMRLSYFTALAVIFVLYAIYSINLTIFDPKAKEGISKILFLVLFFAKTGYLSYLGQKVQNIFKKELQGEYQEHRRTLNDYNSLLESIYKDINRQQIQHAQEFKRISKQIKKKQAEPVKDYMDAYQAKHSLRLKPSDNQRKLDNIHLSSLRKLLSAKLLEAQNQGIQFSIEIPDIIDTYPIKDLLFISMLTELLENALYFSADSEKKSISLALFTEENSYVFIIENTTKENQVDLTNIFEEGYSTTDDKEGMGLKRVRDILNQNPSLSLNTLSRKQIFRQRLECSTEGKQTHE
ncbi:GHKL domain-containing protein [Streptococcus loxodontisalivarius]|uniref:Two-component system sensor histidine kinase AgrC n=1 Tax=Streptococcus loxodontisalivarius TaxID=1349415 RepID=A0ABS2PSW1_9STRE|nr:GHKL domain-containing protein [Streptococcus loxodontisalivarius]MBM7643141.1 two-component system sensor histidine kinase AgrC [Streptococcus loxodontisalivarius]